MGISGEVALAAAKKYTEETVLGGGAIKGKNCVINSISPITGGNRVEFGWTLDDGTEQSANMDVMNGKETNLKLYNVLDYGLVADGTTDNSAAFTAMLGTVPTGANVFFPQGKYMFKSPITVTRTTMSLIGEVEQSNNSTGASNNSVMAMLIYDGDAGTTFLSGGSNCWTFVINNLHFVCPNGFDLAMNAADYTSLPYNLYTYTATKDNINGVDSVNGVDIINCSFRGFSGSGIKMGIHHRVRNCVFHDCRIGLECKYDNMVNNCYFNECETAIKVLAQGSGDSAWTTFNISDTWIDQCGWGIYMDAPQCMLLASNVWMSMFDYAAIQSTGKFYNSKIDGSLTRAGMRWAGLDEADRTAAIAEEADGIVATKFENCEISMIIHKRNIGQGKNKNAVCPSRAITATNGVFESCVITTPSTSGADLFDTAMVTSMPHTIVYAKDTNTFSQIAASSSDFADFKTKMTAL